MEKPLEPQDMEWLDKGVLGITWNDGHRGVYPVRYLRQNCPEFMHLRHYEPCVNAISANPINPKASSYCK